LRQITILFIIKAIPAINILLCVNFFTIGDALQAVPGAKLMRACASEGS
jgi:hypothetical protein